jgi:hypothetical protein
VLSLAVDHGANMTRILIPTLLREYMLYGQRVAATSAEMYLLHGA